MTEAETRDQPGRLGATFWALWALGLFIAVVAMVAVLAYVKTRMDGMPGTIAGGAAVIGFTLLLVGIAQTPHRIMVARGMERPASKAIQRYLRRFLPAMFGYVVLLLAAVSVWNTYEPTGPLAWAIAIAPALPVLLSVRAIGLLNKEETDEFQRACLSYSYRWATMATLSVCSVYGFLDMFGLVPHVELWAAFPIWALALVPGRLMAKREFG